MYEKVRKSEDKKWAARCIPDQLGYMNRSLQSGLRMQPEKAYQKEVELKEKPEG